MATVFVIVFLTLIVVTLIGARALKTQEGTLESQDQEQATRREVGPPPATYDMKVAFLVANASALGRALAPFQQLDGLPPNLARDQLVTIRDAIAATMEEAAKDCENLTPVGVGGGEFRSTTAATIRGLMSAVDTYILEYLAAMDAHSDENVLQGIDDRFTKVFGETRDAYESARQVYMNANNVVYVGK